MLGVDILSMATVLLFVAVRVAMLFLVTPLFGAIPIPVMARVVMVAGTSLALTSAVPPTLIPRDPLQLTSALLHEAIVGGAIAAGLFIGFAAWHFAGRLLDAQIGFGVAGLVDIATKSNMPLLGNLLSMAAVVVFFAIDGHGALLRILALSLEKLPPGDSVSALEIGPLIAQFGTCFAFGFSVVAPIVLCLLLVDFGVAFMSRTMPQMNVFVMSLSLKVIVGLLLLAVIVPLLGGNLRRIFESMFHGWIRLVG